MAVRLGSADAEGRPQRRPLEKTVPRPSSVVADDKLAGQNQARWQVMWIAATGRLSIAMIARRLGLAGQSVQRVADAIVPTATRPSNPTPTISTRHY